jgi:hypothetical protein
MTAVSGRLSPRQRLAAALLAPVLAAGVAGCGHASHVAADGTVQIALNEYRVTPQQVDAHTGGLTFVVHNYGRLTHDLVISRDGQTEAYTAPIPPGGTADLVAELDPGSYELASTVLDDQALGAYGSLHIGS